MLVLTRKIGESIAIDDHIRITVVALKGNQVKLGIEAPADTKVYRAEIYTKIVAENKKAATTQLPDLVTVQAWWQRWQQERGEAPCR